MRIEVQICKKKLNDLHKVGKTLSKKRHNLGKNARLPDRAAWHRSLGFTWCLG